MIDYGTNGPVAALALPEALINKTPRSRDSELERRIRLRFAQSNLPALRRLDVASDDDQVILSGQVATFYERQLAISLSRHVAGVIYVIDNITVQ